MLNRMVISKDDLKFNINSIISHVKTPIIAVVKCDGYGLSIKYAVEAWYNEGVRFFAVAEPVEALLIRELGYDDVDILLMTPIYDEEILRQLFLNDVILTVTGADCARAVSAAAKSTDYIPRVHVKTDTGMGRFGIRDDKQELLETYKTEGVRFEGIFSHFAMSFENKYIETKKQLDLFLGLIEFLNDNGIDVGLKHIANSCAAIRFEDTRLDAVRIGSALVGRLIYKTDLPLRRVGFLEAKVVDMVNLKKGTTTGYSKICNIKHDTKAAVIALGHRSGFGLTTLNDNFRFIDILRNIYHDIKSFKKPPSVVYNGKRLNVIGRVGNQFTIIDTAGSGIKIGDTVTANINVLMIDSSTQRVLI